MGGNTSGIFAKVPKSRRVTGSRPMEHLDDEACNTLFLCFKDMNWQGRWWRCDKIFFKMLERKIGRPYINIIAYDGSTCVDSGQQGLTIATTALQATSP